MITRNRINLSEKQAALIWQQMVGRELPSSEDGPVSVIYPGRTNGDNGPDFRDAVIVNKSHLTRGDVEVHVKSSDWYTHDHHADAAYNNVILHVVLWHDCNSATLLQSGRPVPVLCLARALRHQPYLLPYRLPCFQTLDRVDRQTLEKLLNTAGEERFKQKAMHFQIEILGGVYPEQAEAPSCSLPWALDSCPSAQNDRTGRARKEQAGQVLFRGMMRALGYTKNTKPFEDLANRMPLNSIESREGLAPKQALLLGTAGLLPSQRWPGESAKEKEVQELEQIWQSVGKQVETMRETDWNLSHIYPNNSPVRRIVAQSYLLERYCKRTCREPFGSAQDGPAEGRLLAGILRLVKEAPPAGGHHVLENGLTVSSDGYWRDHFDFALGSKIKIPRIKYGAILGNSKAGEIIVNVILPFAFSWAKLANEPKLMKKVMGLYSSYPKLAENEITRHMENQLGLKEPPDFTACHQQGLIHIFRNYCRQGKCSGCPLGS
jgi:hypothetical protein